VFESSRIPIVVMDAATFEYIDCNPAAVEIYRFASRKEILGKTPLEVSAPVQYDGIPSSEKARFYIAKAMATTELGAYSIIKQFISGVSNNVEPLRT
ncbi:MAG TPA: hypothetical protein DCP92_07280, partial [Nitrospiraceae bacterium]|nr:hypothetical protein [Nitrospiraceae bacterium]